MTDLERINKAIIILKQDKIIKNNDDLAKILGYNKSSISEITNGKVPLSDKFIKIFCSEFGIDINFILKGEGDIYKKCKNLNEPVIEHNSEAILALPGDSDAIPLLETSVEAGFMKGFGDPQITNRLKHYIVPRFKGADFLAYVSGDSMVDKYFPGDIVGCKLIEDPTFFQWGRVYVLDTRQGGVIKKLMPSDLEDHVKAVSFNIEEYPPFDIPKSEILKVSIVLGIVRLV